MTTDLFDWDALASPEDSPPPEDADVSDDPRTADADWPTCEVCGDAIAWSGRGRRPKKCDEHKRRTISSAGTGPATRRVSKYESDRLSRIELALAKEGFKFGAVAGRFVPVTGLTIAERSDNFAASIVKLAADKPKFLDALETVASFEAWMDVAEFFGAVVVAVGVDMKQVHPEGFAAETLGVTETWRKIEGIEAATRVDEEPQYQGPSTNGSGEPRAPMFGPGILPAFTPIGVS